jgi:hypothetical protein
MYLDDGIVACGGQMEAYDQFLERAFKLWTGDLPPDDFRVSVHVVTEPACGVHSCANETDAYLARDLGQYHELAHLMHSFLDGASAESLEEGTATALGPLAPIAFTPDMLAGLDRGFLFAPELTATEYGYTGAFTRFLIERHGVDAYRELFRSLSQGSSEEEYLSAYQRAFSEDLDLAWADFGTGSRCTYDLWFCDQATEARLPFEQTWTGCGTHDTLGFDASDAGAADEEFRSVRIVQIVLDEPRTVMIEMEFARVYLGRCGDCTEQIPGILLASVDDPDFPPSRVDVPLEPGTYSLIIRSQPGGPPRVGVW